MANKPVALDEQSMRRVWRQVKRDEYIQKDQSNYPNPPPQIPQIYTMVRVLDNADEAITATEITGVRISEQYDYDYSALIVNCDPDAPTIPDSADRFTVDHASFIEGCVFPNDLFQVVNIGHKWYAIGCAHTAVFGAYSSADSSVTLSDCNNTKVPVVSLTGDDFTDGEDLIAVWVRSSRIYVVTASGCTEV
jgi:hypothetical protein